MEKIIHRAVNSRVDYFFWLNDSSAITNTPNANISDKASYAVIIAPPPFFNGDDAATLGLNRYAIALPLYHINVSLFKD